MVFCQVRSPLALCHFPPFGHTARELITYHGLSPFREDRKMLRISTTEIAVVVRLIQGQRSGCDGIWPTWRVWQCQITHGRHRSNFSFQSILEGLRLKADLHTALQEVTVFITE